jgi:hypothetical protein
MKQDCSTCKFCVEFDVTDRPEMNGKWGECHRYPPRQLIEVETSYPTVCYALDWCGEWALEPKSEP